MSTRSNIGVLEEDGSLTIVYCHSDGYFSWNGVRLFDHWNSEARARQLIKLGDIGSLGEIAGQKHNFDWTFEEQFQLARGGIDWDKVNQDPRHRWTRYYGRDRGEKDIKPRSFASYEAFLEKDGGQEYLYLWDVRREEWITLCFHDEDPPFYRLEDIVAEVRREPKSGAHGRDSYSDDWVWPNPIQFGIDEEGEAHLPSPPSVNQPREYVAFV